MSRQEVQGIRKIKGLDNKLLKYKGVIGVDVDHKQVKGLKRDKIGITVYVKKKVAKEELTANEVLPAYIEGIESDVVECPNVWPLPKSSQQFAQTGVATTEGSAELVGGLSISNQYNLQSYGTLGIILVESKAPIALSCAHVMVNPPLKPGQVVIEPGGVQGGKYPADSIGKVSVASYGEGNVDLALVPIEGRESKVSNVENIGTVTGFENPDLGEIVRKMGARTGLTEGVVGSTTLTWMYETDLGTITLYNQIRVDNAGDTVFGMPGDSGAAVINSSLKMIGMVVSGEPGKFTVCNRSFDISQAAHSQSTLSFAKEKSTLKK